MKKDQEKKDTTKKRKIRLNKKTLKDLDSKTENVKGGALTDACRTETCKCCSANPYHCSFGY
jgi:hypothetical protein